MNLDWSYIESHYRELEKEDVYEQPDEPTRTEITKQILQMAPLEHYESVLDVGCGYGYAQELFSNCDYAGLTLCEEEYKKARKLGRTVLYMDYNFPRLGREFDLIFSSHSLEHSPFPLITLMEWHRVGKTLLLIVPNPDYYGYVGKNHYSVAAPSQVRWWLRRAGWEVKWRHIAEADIAFFAVRQPRIGSEGWANELSPEVFENDRDNTV